FWVFGGGPNAFSAFAPPARLQPLGDAAAQSPGLGACLFFAPKGFPFLSPLKNRKAPQKFTFCL
ncbi:MAG: hypothetical protein RRY21_04905, partial [Oscillospiraceae bacterium]